MLHAASKSAASSVASGQRGGWAATEPSCGSDTSDIYDERASTDLFSWRSVTTGKSLLS